jgi:PKD repeat protein
MALLSFLLAFALPLEMQHPAKELRDWHTKKERDMRAQESRLAHKHSLGNIAWRVFGALLITAVCFAPASWSATLYVDQSHPSASDGNSGSEGSPFLTITHAANVVRAGDTVIVKPGDYAERIFLSSVNSGTAENKVTFRSEPRHQAKMEGFVTTDCDYVRIEGFEVEDHSSSNYRGGIVLDSDHVEVVDNYIHDIHYPGISTKGSDSYHYVGYNLIEGCQMGIAIGGTGSLIEHNEVRALRDHGTGDDVDYGRFFGFDHVWRNNWFHGTKQSDVGTAHLDGFQTWSLSSSSFTQNITITGNVVEDVHQGVMMESNDSGNVRDIYITNNVFTGMQNWGISSKLGCLNIVVLNNIFTDCGLFTIGLRNGSSGVIKNNIFYRVERSYWASDSPLESSNNIVHTVYDGFTPNEGDILDEPQFVDYDNFNGPDGVPFTADDGYLLLETSPGIDQGATVALSTDQIGTPRPQGGTFDVGPREFVSGSGSVVTVGVNTPTPQVTKNGSIAYVVSYGNADAVTLDASDVTLNTTGTASGSVSVSGSGTGSRTITISNVAGDGTLSISLATNTASNTDSSAPAFGPSATATVDNTAPAITITGNSPLTWAHGTAYLDPGATAVDGVSGDVTGDLDVQVNVDSSVVGTHSVSYVVADAVGNGASATRTVEVTDQSSPVITLLGSNPLTMIEDDVYTEMGATAFDAVDGDVSGAITSNSSIDNTTPGTYSVDFSVADSAGNVANTSRTVQVLERDTTPPVITVLGPNPASVGKDQTYDDGGATAVDETDGNLTHAISVENNVDTSATGSYSVVYRVLDAEGNEGVATRSVTVVESNDAPELTPVGAQSVDEAQTLSFTVSASDPQGTSPMLTASSLPNGASFNDNGNGTGSFDWTPDHKQGKKQPYVVEFAANDGELTDSESVSITVKNVNRSPKLDKPGGGPKKGRERETTSLAVSATDEDGDALVLTADTSSLPDGNDATFTDNGDGTGALIWTPKDGDAGMYQVTVTATDDVDPSLSDSEGFDLDIEVGIGPSLTFHVATDADPGSADGSEANPFVTIADAMNVVEAGRGDIVMVYAGSYFEDVALKEGTSLVGADGPYHTLVFGGSNVQTDILRMEDGSAVRGFTFAGKEHGSAVELNPGANAIVSNCVLANSAAGLHLRDDAVATATNLTIYGMRDYGILADGISQLTEITNCIIANNGIGIGSDVNAVLDASFNALFNNGTDYDGPAAFADYNDAPMFVDPPDYNFHLMSDSPYRDAGDPDASQNDLNGTRNDLGADGGPRGRIDVLAPFASIFASISKAIAPVTIIFDASDSADEWGIDEFVWDFDALDGLTADATGATVEHTFNEDGVYTVTLTVTDHNGHTATATADVELGSGVPTVSASADPLAGPAPLTVNLTGTGTTAEGGAVSLQWDFDNDGVADSTDASTSVTFAADTEPGSYAITLTGTSENSLTAQTSLSVTVTAGPVEADETVEPSTETTVAVTDPNSPIAGTQATLPAGSVSDPVVVSISEPSSVPALPEDVTASAVVSIDPSGLVLSMPATISLPLASAKALPENGYDVLVYDANLSEWTQDPIANVTVSGNTSISFSTTQLGIFAAVQSITPLPTVEFTETAHSVSESASQVTLTVALNPVLTAGGSVTVRYLTANVSAESGEDYTSSTGTLTFDATKSTDTIVIPILDDVSDEPIESFRVVLTDPQGAVLGANASASITIMDNDEAASFGEPTGSGCSAGSIGTGSSNPPAGFMMLVALVFCATFGGRLVKRPMNGQFGASIAIN